MLSKAKQKHRPGCLYSLAYLSDGCTSRVGVTAYPLQGRQECLPYLNACHYLWQECLPCLNACRHLSLKSPIWHR